MTDEAVIVSTHDRITDVAGLLVGHAQDHALQSGVTVILPGSPVVMGVDVRGGAPGTRDTDALDPTCLVDRFHGLVLSGGSVFGLAAVDGVVNWLSQHKRGLALGPHAIPVVPGAILFDLMNGGDKTWGAEPPYRTLGMAACEAAMTDVPQGRVGAGAGAVAGDRPGGFGTAALVAGSGFTVGAIVAVNSFGPKLDSVRDRISMPKAALLGTNTTLAAVATDLVLDKAACRRLAIMAHDGLARTLRPVHTPFDGDTVFAMATGKTAAPAPFARTLAVAGTMAADALARAVEKALAASRAAG